MFQAIQRRYDINARLQACAEIHRAIDFAYSIDEFIDRNNHDPYIAEAGKLQIAYAIAQAEGESKLAVNRANGKGELAWDNLDKTWLVPFTQALFGGVRTIDVESIDKNITIICFNYDRYMLY